MASLLAGAFPLLTANEGDAEAKAIADWVLGSALESV